MVNTSLHVAAVNAASPPANLPATGSARNSAAPSTFQSIYQNLPGAPGSQGDQPDDQSAARPGSNAGPTQPGPNAGAAQQKKSSRANLVSTNAAVPIPPPPDTMLAARALALALAPRVSAVNSHGSQSNDAQSTDAQSTGQVNDPQTGQPQPDVQTSGPSSTKSGSQVPPKLQAAAASRHMEAGSTAPAAASLASSFNPKPASQPSTRDPLSKLGDLAAAEPKRGQTMIVSASRESQASAPAPSEPATQESQQEASAQPIEDSSAAPPAAASPIVAASASNPPHPDTAPRRTRFQGSAAVQTEVQNQVQLPVAEGPVETPAASPVARPEPAEQSDRVEAAPSSEAAVSKNVPAAKPENLAFSIHLEDEKSGGAPATDKPQDDKPQTVAARADTPAARADSPASSALGSSNIQTNIPRDTDQAKRALSNTDVIVPSADPSTVARESAGPAVWASQTQDAPHVPAAVAVHEAQPILSDAPAVNPNGEILLHLQGADQSSAAIRLVDRAGSVNVSVHASDTELRTTLRSNVGELVSQLNGQGWKTDFDKPGLAPVRAQTAQDPRSDGQRSGNQQHSSSGENRQPQRDRRSAGDRWLDELQRQTLAQSANSGGKN